MSATAFDVFFKRNGFFIFLNGIDSIVKPTLFKAIMQFFPHVARLVDGNYTVDSFSSALAPVFSSMTASKVAKATSIKAIYDHFLDCLNRDFTL